jgi:hypothetical protein
VTGAAAQVLRTTPCSRNFPLNLVGGWTPTTGDVARAEKHLEAAIDAAFTRLDDERARRPLAYSRQYAGFLRDGHRVLYVDAGPSVLCDGGAESFGAVFDLEKDAFDSFSFSGLVTGQLKERSPAR